MCGDGGAQGLPPVLASAKKAIEETGVWTEDACCTIAGLFEYEKQSRGAGMQQFVQNIVFIGGGNMASAILGGLRQQGVAAQ